MSDLSVNQVTDEVIVTTLATTSEDRLVPKKRRRLNITCDHEENAHFVKADLERQLKLKQVNIVMTEESQSPVWIICGYPEIEKKICTSWIICTLCHSYFSVGTGATTSAAKRHVENKHLQKLNELRGLSAGQSLITEHLSLPVRPLSVQRKTEIINAMTSFIVQCMQPASILNDPNFRHLIYTCLNIQNSSNPETIFKVPDRQTFSRSILPQRYEKCKEEIKVLLESAAIEGFKNIVGGLTMDEWRDEYRKVAYLALTFHFLDDNFQSHYVNLGTEQLHETDSNAINSAILSICHEYNINLTDCLFTTDSGSNMKAACQQSRWTRVACMGHDLHLLVDSDFLKNEIADESIQFLSSVVTTCREVVAFFKRGKGQSKLETMRKARGLQPCSLKLDVATRWNSQLMMLFSVLSNYNLIIDILSKENRHDLIAKLDYGKIRSLIKFLLPFESLTKKMSSESHITMSQYWPSVLKLKKFLQTKTEWSADDEKLVDETDEPVIYLSEFDLVKELLLDGITKPVGRKHQMLQVTNFHKIATALDPRYKSLRMCTETEKEKLQRLLESECIRISSHSQPVQVHVCQRTVSLHDEFMDLGEEEVEDQQPRDLAKDEVKIYFGYKLSSVTSCGLDKPDFLIKFWNNEGRQFPNLRRLARLYLAPPVTSTPCERLFSKAGDIVTARRSQLSPSVVHMLLFLKQNM